MAISDLERAAFVTNDEPTLATNFRPSVNPWERRLILGKTEETTELRHRSRPVAKGHAFDGTVLEFRKGSRTLGMTHGCQVWSY